MSYEFRSINFSRIFPRLQSIYQPVKLARSLEAASRNEEAKFFINFLGMEMPRVLKEGGSIAEHNERRLESSGRITEQLDSDLWSCSNGNNYIKEHNELVRAIVSVRNPIVSIIGGEISQPTFALATYTPFRIVTEEAILRLGSPTIGFISGLSYMYSRMADDIEFSRFLIMSSATIEPISAIISGIATHYVKSEDIDRLVCSLCSEKAPNILNILSIIDNYSSIPREDDFSAARKMPPCFLSDVNLYKALVDAFSPDSCEEMLEKIHSLLESDIHEDAKPILKSAADSLSKDKRIETIIRLLLIDYARGWDLGKCLDVENYLTPGIINKLVLSHSSLRTMGSLAGVHREMKSTFHKDVVLRFKDTPECSKELPSNPIYHEILDIPSTNDIKMVVTGEMRDSDDYSMEENELQEW